MKGCAVPGSPVLLSVADNPKRKLKYTWELVLADGCWVGINTGLPNRLVREGIETGIIAELMGYPSIRPEVRYGEKSRVDLLLSGPSGLCYVEVKNVTLVEGNVALFPDAITTRGQKHLRELMEMVRRGHRGVIFFVVQRGDGKSVAPADYHRRGIREAVAPCGEKWRGAPRLSGKCYTATDHAYPPFAGYSVIFIPFSSGR